MKTNPKISVVTVTYNAEKTLERTIKSVVAQNYKNLEYIVVDGKSTDSTLKIIKKYKNFITKYISEPDKGIYDAMNKGIGMATGELIGLLNADDWYEKNAIEAVATNYSKNIDLLYGKVIYHFPNRKKIVGQPNFRQYFNILREPGPPHRGFFISKEYYKNHKYDVSYSISADFKFLFEAFKNKAHVNFIDEVLVNSSPGGTSSAIGKPPLVGYRVKREVANQEFRSRKEVGYSMVVNYLRRLIDYCYDFGSLLKNTSRYFKKGS